MAENISAGGATAPQPLLDVRDIAKSFGPVQAVRGVSFAVQSGEVVAIVGDNGAGKSTVVKMIAGALHPDRGEIVFDGSPVTMHSTEDARDEGIETMYQDLALIPDVDAAGNIFLGREPMRRFLGILPVLDTALMRERSEALLNRVKIRLPSLTTPVARLSGGQRQAVAIARFLLSDRAKLIIMDEPTAALGVQEQRKVLQLIEALKTDGMTVLVISHNLEQVFRIADKVVVLRSGEVAGIENTADVTHEHIVSLIMGAGAAEERAA